VQKAPNRPSGDNNVPGERQCVGTRATQRVPRHRDDGAGNPFCVSSDSESPEVSRWDWIDLDFESSEGQLADFLEAWVEPPT
jgi:hypothetical protein